MSLIHQVQCRTRPRGMVIMTQSWRELLFLHWKWSADAVQKSLPKGLTVDVWDEQAWIGIVPFFMQKVRPFGLPRIPGISDFLELNVRTYVRDQQGRPGVWFYSLDCNQPLAVWLARTFYNLPYYHATMEARVAVDSGMTSYTSRRLSSRAVDHFEYKVRLPIQSAREGSLEQFLIERYRLFSEKDGQLYTSQVWHHPYKFSGGKCLSWSSELLKLAGFNVGSRNPDHLVMSPGVDVLIYPLRPLEKS